MLVSHPHPINGYLANKETCIKRDGKTIGCNACDVRFQYFQTVADLIWFEMYSDFWNGLNLSVNTIINLHVGVDVISRSHSQRKSIRKRLLYFRIIVFLWLKITFTHSLSKSRFYKVDIQASLFRGSVFRTLMKFMNSWHCSIQLEIPSHRITTFKTLFYPREWNK